MREHEQLDVLDPEAERRETRLERLERLRRVGPRVDERERLAAENPAVDGPDGERRREDDPLHGQAGGATTTAGSAANAKTVRNGRARARVPGRPARGSTTRGSPPDPGGAVDLEHVCVDARQRVGPEGEHAVPRPARAPAARRRTRPAHADARSRKVSSSGITTSTVVRARERLPLGLPVVEPGLRADRPRSEPRPFLLQRAVLDVPAQERRDGA